MKFIKKQSDFISNDDVDEIKDIYLDIIDDIGLNDVNHAREMTNKLDSIFEKNPIDISISIRTIGDRFIGFDESDKIFFNKIKDSLIPSIKRLRTIGYNVRSEELHMKIDSWNYITAGIKIIITK